jgi:hypothetical protein
MACAQASRAVPTPPSTIANPTSNREEIRRMSNLPADGIGWILGSDSGFAIRDSGGVRGGHLESIGNPEFGISSPSVLGEEPVEIIGHRPPFRAD